MYTAPPPLVLEHAVGMNNKNNRGVIFHPTDGGRSTLIHGSGKLVLMYNLADPHAQRVLQGHDAEVTCLDVSSDGELLVSGQDANLTNSSSVIVWDYNTLSPKYIADSHKGGVSDCQISHDKKFIATLGAKDGTLHVMDVGGSGGSAAGFFNKKVSGGGAVGGMTVLGTLSDPICAESGRALHGVAWVPPEGVTSNGGHNGRSVREQSYKLCAAFNTGVRILTWMFDVKRMAYTLSATQCHVPGAGGRMGGFVRHYLCSAVSDDGQYLLCGTTTGDLVIYSVPSNTYRTCVNITNNGVTSIAAVGGDAYLVGGGDGRVSRVTGRDQDWKLVGEVTLGVPVVAIAMSSDRVEAAVTTSAGQLYRVLTGNLSFTLVSEFHFSVINDVSCSARHPHYMATASSDTFVRVWDLNTYSVTAKQCALTTPAAPSKSNSNDNGNGRTPVSAAIAGPSSSVPTCVHYHDSELIIVGYNDGRVTCFDAPQLSSVVWSMNQVHKDGVAQIAACRDYYVTVGRGESIARVWSMATRELIAQLQDSACTLCRVHIDNTAPNILHTVGVDGSVFTFDLAQVERRTESNMAKPRKIASHTPRGTLATCVAQRYDHEHELLVGTSDGRILFFDIDYADAVYTVVDRAKVSVLCLAVCPNAPYFVSGGRDGALTLYQFSDSVGGGAGCVVVSQVVAHSDAVQRVAWSSDGRQVHSVDSSGQLNVSNFFLAPM
eukprot:PhM_4_TR17542/c0_g1_i1/m.87033